MNRLEILYAKYGQAVINEEIAIATRNQIREALSREINQGIKTASVKPKEVKKDGQDESGSDKQGKPEPEVKSGETNPNPA